VGDLRIGWWSPDGTRIAYTVKDRRGLWTIWLADSAGGNQQQLTTEGFEFPAQDPQPWSPDGTQILYVSSRTGTGDIFVHPVDGTGPRQLTRDVRSDDLPGWSPDGRWIVFRSQRGRQTDVWLVPAAGGTELRVTDDQAEEENIQWVPGTTRVAFTRATTTSGWWTLSLSDGREQRLTPDTIRVGDWDLSRDRTQLVYEILRGGDASDLAVVPVAGGPSRVVVTGGTRHRSPKWSPDGSRIAFGSTRSGNMDIWVVDLEGGEPRQVTDWPSYEWPEAEWTSDGSGLYFQSLRDADGFADLWVVPIAGGEPRRLTTIGAVWDVAQSPVTEDLFVVTTGREGRDALARLLPDGRLETLWDRSNVTSLWARGVMPSGDSIMIDVQMPDGNVSSVLVPVRGGEGRQVVGDGEVGADWSADGTRLLYYVGTTSRDIAVRTVADGSVRRLTNTPEDERLARWGPDYESVVFLREVQRRAIVTVDVGSLIGR
jgi:TolB protein